MENKPTKKKVNIIAPLVLFFGSYGVEHLLVKEEEIAHQDLLQEKKEALVIFLSKVGSKKGAPSGHNSF
jgi:hypothetical protein